MSVSSLNGKVVLITGSGQGIGKATAEHFGKLGARICLNGRSAGKLKVVGDELRAMGVHVQEVAADVSDPQACEHLIAECIRHFGQLDVLVNNAGIASRGTIAETTPESWEQTMKINFNGAVNCTYYALPHLSESKGSVVLVSSMAAKVGVPGHAAYSASKMGLTAYARALQNEFKKEDLHCGLVFVGFTENETAKEILGPDGEYKSIPNRKGVKTASRESVAQAIARCVTQRKNQVTLTLMGKAQHILLKFAPGLVYFLLRRSFREYEETYR
ncbi:MAG: SDR family oxidoreductase [Flavobacteriales bacterium]|nr:SDR family oxidoreductase [Bacteroidota bacterium]MCB9241968.1 SDR family oxidoreductase [Flavobacteriales bacterium]